MRATRGHGRRTMAGDCRGDGPRGPGTRPDDPLVMTERGLFCPAGGFHVDPWERVDLAVTTHAHGDDGV